MKLIYFIMVLISFQYLQAQDLKPINSKEVTVNWYKTTHIIFPTEIKYVSNSEELIATESTRNILSVKANEMDFKGIASLSVATLDGQFYTFAVRYTDNIQNSSFDVSKGIIKPYNVTVSQGKDIHLIFPNELIYLDFGSDVVEASQAEDINNIIRISAKSIFEQTTNVSVQLKDKSFYTFNVRYSPNTDIFSYTIGEPQKEKTAFNSEILIDDVKKEISDKVRKRGRTINNFGIKKDKFVFTVENIFVRDNKLIFRFGLENLSNIRYDVDYIKFYVVDKKKTKKTASQDIEQFPLFIEDLKPSVTGKTKERITVCFEKFTIPDNKFFIIEVNEKNGGRHIYYKLRNKDILTVENL